MTKWKRDYETARILAEQSLDAQERLLRREAILQARAASPSTANIAGADILRASTTSPRPFLGIESFTSPRLPSSGGLMPAFPLIDDFADRSASPGEATSPKAECGNPFSIAPSKVKADELEQLQSSAEDAYPQSPALATLSPPLTGSDGLTPASPPVVAAETRPLSPEAYAYLPRSLTPTAAAEVGASSVGAESDAALRACIEAELRRKQERAKRKAKGQVGGARSMLLQLEEAEDQERQACIARQRLRAMSASPDVAQTGTFGGASPLWASSPSTQARTESPFNAGTPPLVSPMIRSTPSPFLRSSPSPSLQPPAISPPPSRGPSPLKHQGRASLSGAIKSQASSPASGSIPTRSPPTVHAIPSSSSLQSVLSRTESNSSMTSLANSHVNGYSNGTITQRHSSKLVPPSVPRALASTSALVPSPGSGAGGTNGGAAGFDRLRLVRTSSASQASRRERSDGSNGNGNGAGPTSWGYGSSSSGGPVTRFGHGRHNSSTDGFGAANGHASRTGSSSSSSTDAPSAPNASGSGGSKVSALKGLLLRRKATK